MKTGHDGDCSIYASLDNSDMPEAGICTCGYGRERLRRGDYSEIYSRELSAKLQARRNVGSLVSQIEAHLEDRDGRKK